MVRCAPLLRAVGACKGPQADSWSGNGLSAGFLLGFVEQTYQQLRHPLVRQVTLCVCVCVWERERERERERETGWQSPSLAWCYPCYQGEGEGARMGQYYASGSLNFSWNVWSLLPNPHLPRLSRAIQWLRLCLPTQEVQVGCLVEELISHMPWGQKPKHKT